MATNGGRTDLMNETSDAATGVSLKAMTIEDRYLDSYAHFSVHEVWKVLTFWFFARRIILS